MTEELTWDYTGDESSPLLQRAASPFYRWACLFSRTWAGNCLYVVDNLLAAGRQRCLPAVVLQRCYPQRCYIFMNSDSVRSYLYLTTVTKCLFLLPVLSGLLQSNVGLVILFISQLEPSLCKLVPK